MTQLPPAAIEYLAASADRIDRIDVGNLIVQIGTGLAIVIGAVASFRLRKRAADTTELSELRDENEDLRSDVLALTGWTFSVRTTLARDHGISVPDPPELLSQRKPKERK
jgi:hypothetical protein